MAKTETHIPKLRFKGFSDVWQKQPLGNQFKLKNGFAFKSEYFQEQVSHIEVLTPGSVLPGGGYQDGKSRYYSQNGEIPQEFIFKSQDIFITLTDLTPSAQALGYPAFVPKNDKIYLHNQRLGKVCDNKANDRFLLNLLCTDFYHKYVVETATGTTVKHSSAQNILKYEASFPNLEEQTQIGDLFQKIDQVIEFQQKALDTARDYKKSMLQKMFPQKGEKVPQIRFDGFSGDWEEKKVGEISKTTFGGGTPNTKVLEYWKGDIPWIQSSDILIDNVLEFKPTKFINSEAVKNSATKIVPKNSLAIVTRVGVGKLALVEFEYTTSQDFLSLSYLKYDLLFSLYSLYILLQEEKNKTQGTAIKGITKVDFLSKNIFIPLRKEEQQKIGAFFQKLDQRIEQHEKKLQSYQNLKKAMLQRLFV
ncbi:restriction endonuclease subunit S [Wohlfahrtiimonas chitiniclastica]|uniref:restriction endonuclease subunit S n=1 Tax=Wohlfahrtiimonas chitiniclastica TaxID=400946 RepID=UPI001BCC12E6|nr:restriction endonuclease subunit S [Wohlfahrtiimonas chitiniclastica]MBS7837402.1 restriction endonuclease subunit S [Wohlfahrtiimonas chitiniclastica]